MAEPVNSRAAQFGNIYKSLAETPQAYGFKADMDAVRGRDAELKAYLGTTDYTAQNKEATNLAQLQLAMSLMSRGFGAMGAAPQPGEGALGALGRTLIAPVAADASAIAGPLMKQRAATRAAEQQEDRQRKLAAYTGEESSAKERRALALDLLGKKPTASGLNEAVRYVLKQGENEKWDFVPQKGGTGRAQVRLQKGSGAPFDIQSLALRPLADGEIAVSAADLENYGVSLKPADAVAAGLSAGDYNLVNRDGSIYRVGDQTPIVRAISKGKDMGKWLVLGGDMGEGKILSSAALKEQGLSPRKISADKAPTKPWGLDDPDFKATLAGYLAGMGGRQDRLGIGKAGVRFVPGNYDPDKGLDPADPNFPFVRADGATFTQADKKKFADRLTTAYFNTFKSIRAGESRVDLNKAFTERFFKQNAQQLGLTKAPAGLPVNPEAVRTEAGATAFYTRAPDQFLQQGDAGAVLRNLPPPVRGKNFSSGVGKLKLFAMAGVPFGPGTNSPPPLAEGEDVTKRADQVRALDRSSIQQRILAETIAKGTSLAGTLSQSSTPRRDDQLKVVGKALSDKTKAMAKTQGSPASLQAAQLFAAGLDGIERMDSMDASAKISGGQGFIKGPAVALGLRLTGKNFLSYFQTTQEDEATRDFVAGIPVLRELFSRQLVKAVEGEGARVSTPDVQGVQKTLSSLNENTDYSAAKMRELRRHLVKSVEYAASQLGNFTVPDETLEQAARLGIDLKAITGQNGYYSPYLNNGKYAVSKGQVPGFSKQYQDSLRNQGLFEYVSDRGRIPRYRLINVAKDKNKVFQPVMKEDGSFSTFTASKADLNNPELKYVVDFNRSWLRKTYNLRD